METSFYDFKKELGIRAKAYSDSYMLEYMTTLLRTLSLSVPGVEEIMEREAKTLQEFNVKDGYSKPV